MLNEVKKTIRILENKIKKEDKTSIIEDLHNRQRDIILNTCNKIGCKDCDLKWEDSCSANELQNKIYNEEERLKNEK